MYNVTEAMVRQIVASVLVNLDGRKLDFGKTQAAIGNPKQLARGFEQLINNNCRLQIVGKLVVDLDSPHIPEGWELLPDGDQIQSRMTGNWTFDPTKLQDYLDEGQKNGKSILGNELRKRLEGKPVMRAALIDFLLRPECRHLIPDSWKSKIRFAWGDIYRYSDGGLRVRCLDWRGHGWDWRHYRLDSRFRGGYPALLAS